MGTRGAYGFHIAGQDKVTYNHSDSYPDGLGQDIAQFVVDTDDATLKRIAQVIRLVPSNDDNYARLRDTQGQLEPYRDDGLGDMIDNHEFLADSLFCEYAYIINVDTGKLEFYQGFQKQPGQGRYAHLGGDAAYSGGSIYYGVSLAGEIAFDDVRSGGAEAFFAWCQALTD